MKHLNIFWPLAILIILFAACAPAPQPTPTLASPPPDTATSSPVPPTETASPAPTETASPEPTETESAGTPVPWPTGESACTLTVSGPTTLYTRPSLAAAVFAEVDAGFVTAITGRTVDGWVGFDPAIAQAANMGSFRLRWAPFDAATLSGDCASVPEFWAPLAGLCYTMPMEAVDILAEPLLGSALLTTLEPGEFAAVLGIAEGGWAQVFLSPGNTGLDGLGWIDSPSLNVNGPCEAVFGAP